MFRCIVDNWEDYSELSYKVYLGEATAFFPKSVFALGKESNEFICSHKDKWRYDKLEEAADRKLIRAA